MSTPSPHETKSSAVSNKMACGGDVSGTAGLLDAHDISAPASSKIGRSVAGWTFIASACGSGASQDILRSSCDPQDFPWTSSPSDQNVELFSRGARGLRLATFEVNAKPVLREVVLDAAPGGVLAKKYREHLSSCGADVVATANGRLQQATLKGPVNLVVAFQDDARIVALQGLIGQSTDQLNRLAQAAVGRT